MLTKRGAGSGVMVALLAGALLLLAPSSAHAAWTHAEARIIDRAGFGYVPLLNVRVANHAVNDSATVTAVEFSDDGTSWYSMPYTGLAQDWVLSGASGRTALAVRFLAADGSASDVVWAGITVDAAGPSTAALRGVRVRSGSVASFRYEVRDAQSPRVRARLVIRGRGVTKCVRLGVVRTGRHVARVELRLRPGSYRWSVEATDLAGWAQQTRVSRALVVR